MRVRVERRSGRMETITIVNPVRVTRGRKLTCLHSGPTDYYFDGEGYYDGHGGVSPKLLGEELDPREDEGEWIS